mgnify:CR=1 FL=1
MLKKSIIKSIVLILARKNSRRLKNKNIKKLDNDPLILWTIKFAKKIKKNHNEILVSSDSSEIIKIAKHAGVMAPWKRPNFLSKSKISSYKSAKHAINWYKTKISSFDTIILLQPTSPFRSLKSFNKMYKFFKDKKLNSIASFSKITSLPSNSEKIVPNGNIYINKIENLYKYKNFINKETEVFILKNKKEKIDIDTKKDWLLAKKIIKKNEK